MSALNESILDEVKKTLGIDQGVTVFDNEIKIHINSALATLSQLGIGPVEGWEIQDATDEWSDFVAEDLHLNPIKTYVHLRVKMLFDPPTNSWITTAMKEQIEQLEWRLNIVREDTIPFVPTPLPDEEDQWELDGGVI